MLEVKRAAMAAGAHCSICPLLKNDVTVPATPPLAGRKLRLVIVGEGPGRTEEKYRAPFTGMAGRAVLDKTLSRNGLKRSEAWVGNVALCRGDSDKENERAAECCAPRLLQELRGQNHDVPILALGKLAAKAVLGVRSILVSRGFIWTVAPIAAKHVAATLKAAYRGKEGERRNLAVLRGETFAARAPLAGRVVLPTIAPSFVLRADTWHPVFQLDIARAARVVAGSLPAPLEDESPYRVGGLDVLRGMAAEVSLDVETDGIETRSTKLLCVGISDGERTGVIWPWKPAYAKPLSKWLAGRRVVVCHNGLFDIPVLRNHGVE